MPGPGRQPSVATHAAASKTPGKNSTPWDNAGGSRASGGVPIRSSIHVGPRPKQKKYRRLCCPLDILSPGWLRAVFQHHGKESTERIFHDMFYSMRWLAMDATPRLPLSNPSATYSGRSRTALGFRCVSAPKGRRSIFISISLLLLCWVIAAGTLYPRLIQEHLAFIAAAILHTVVVFECLLHVLLVHFTDPGIIPRNLPFTDSRLPDGVRHAGGKIPKSRMVMMETREGGEFRFKSTYCEVCRFYRPRRVVHCRICDNCVSGFDHHCSWLGNCIGARNYSYFYWTLFFSVAVGMLSIALSLCAYGVTVRDLHIAKGKEVWTAFLLAFLTPQGIGGLFLVPSASAILAPLGVLLSWHMRLTAANIKTFEHAISLYEDGVFNPFNEGVWRNCFAILCAPRPPSVLRFAVRKEYGVMDGDCEMGWCGGKKDQSARTTLLSKHEVELLESSFGGDPTVGGTNSVQRSPESEEISRGSIRPVVPNEVLGPATTEKGDDDDDEAVGCFPTGPTDPAAGDDRRRVSIVERAKTMNPVWCRVEEVDSIAAEHGRRRSKLPKYYRRSDGMDDSDSDDDGAPWYEMASRKAPPRKRRYSDPSLLEASGAPPSRGAAEFFLNQVAQSKPTVSGHLETGHLERGEDTLPPTRIIDERTPIPADEDRPRTRRWRFSSRAQRRNRSESPRRSDSTFQDDVITAHS